MQGRDSEKKRVCVVLPGVLPFPPTGGGAVENLVWHYAAENEKRRDFELTVFSPADPAAARQAEKLECCRVEFIPTRGIAAFVKKAARYAVNRFCKKYIGNFFVSEVKKRMRRCGEFDAIIFENCPEYNLVFGNAGAKRILHLHNDTLHAGSRRAAEIFASYDAIWSISDFIASRAATISPSQKICKINNCVDFGAFGKDFGAEERVLLRRRFGIEKDDIVVLYVGRIVKHKGVKELLEAFMRLPPRRNLKLVIAGGTFLGENLKDPYLLELKRMAAPFMDNIIFTGYVDYGRLNEIYAMADIAAVPSQWDEPSGLTVIEAMDAGCALAVSDCGGIPELVEGTGAIKIKRGENYVKELSAALEKLAGSPGLRASMRAQNRARGAQFSVEKYYCRFVELLGGLIGGNPKAS